LLLSHQIKLFHHQHATPQIVTSVLINTMALISAHPTKLLHHHSQHHQTVTSALTNTMALLRQTPSSCCILPNSFTSAHENHGTGLTHPIKLLHHPKTSLSVLANTMALLLHTPSSCCITTKQLHQRSQKPWYCYQYTPSSCCFTPKHLYQTPWPCSYTPHQVVASPQNTFSSTAKHYCTGLTHHTIKHHDIAPTHII
jgi:hypothetical protein